MHIHRQGGSWHNQCRGGYQVAGRTQTSGSSSERTGREKTRARGTRKVSSSHKPQITAVNILYVFNENDECLPLSFRLEQLRKQLAQEQQQAELKAQQEKEKAKKEEDAHKLKQEEEKQQQEQLEKEQQTQMNKEVRGHLVLILCQVCSLLQFFCLHRYDLDLNREKKIKSMLKRKQNVNGKTENCRRNKKRRRDSYEKRLFTIKDQANSMLHFKFNFSSQFTKSSHLRLNIDIFLQRIEEIMKRTRKGEAELKVL